MFSFLEYKKSIINQLAAITQDLLSFDLWGDWETSPSSIFLSIKLLLLFCHSYWNPSYFLGFWNRKTLLFTAWLLQVAILLTWITRILVACIPTCKVGRLDKITGLYLIKWFFNYLMFSSFVCLLQIHQKHQQVFITYIVTIFSFSSVLKL